MLSQGLPCVSTESIELPCTGYWYSRPLPAHNLIWPTRKIHVFILYVIVCIYEGEISNMYATCVIYVAHMYRKYV